MVRENKTKAKLQAGGVVFGVGVTMYDPSSAELAGALGFDFVLVDCEHDLFNERAVEDLIRAADLNGLTTIVRMQNNPELILHVLDGGAQGILVARVNSLADAQAVLNSAKFHPEGKRTIFFRSRGANFGLEVSSAKQWTLDTNHETLIGCIIEEIDGVNNLAEILALPAIDMIDLGALDLAHSMGWPAQQEVDKLVDKIVADSIKAGKAVSTMGSIQNMPGALANGFRIFTVSPRGLFQSGATEFLIQARQLVNAKGLGS